MKSKTVPDTIHALVIGGGAREHALVWKLHASKRVRTIYTTHPQNPGIAGLAQATDAEDALKDAGRLSRFCAKKGVNLIVCGPEGPLADGIADKLAGDGVAVVGPTREGAQLEASKVYAKRLMRAALVPTGEARAYRSAEEARAYLKTRHELPVIKASGLAAGKGVVVPETLEEAQAAVDRMLVEGAFGEAGREIVLEERLHGEEVSVIALTDGRTIALLDACQDHKRLGEGDTGPNTGGMGAYCPAPVATDEVMTSAWREVLVPTVDALKREGVDYRGVLYAGLMLTHAGPKVLEFNVRFGDPECQALLVRMRADLAEVLYRTATGSLEDAEIDWDPRPSVCVVLAAEGYPGASEKGKPIEGLDEVEAMRDVRVFHASTRREGGRLVTGGGRCMSVVALGETLAEARNRANEAAEMIRFEGKIYRRDIGHRALDGVAKR